MPILWSSTNNFQNLILFPPQKIQLQKFEARLEALSTRKAHLGDISIKLFKYAPHSQSLEINNHK